MIWNLALSEWLAWEYPYLIKVRKINKGGGVFSTYIPSILGNIEWEFLGFVILQRIQLLSLKNGQQKSRVVLLSHSLVTKEFPENEKFLHSYLLERNFNVSF